MFPPFTDCSARDIGKLVDHFPFAWVMTRGLEASPLPLLAEYGKDGEIVSLLGHCGKRNHIVADLMADPAALIVFQGPHGYIPTGIVTENDWAPTWNYAAVRFVTEVEFVPDETAEAVDRLLDHMEGPADQRWTWSHLGDRYRTMLDRIIAFRAHVRAVRPTFKLGQDESPAIFKEIVTRLDNRQLAAWMEAQVRS